MVLGLHFNWMESKLTNREAIDDHTRFPHPYIIDSFHQELQWQTRLCHLPRWTGVDMSHVSEVECGIDDSIYHFRDHVLQDVKFRPCEGLFPL